MSTPVSVIQVAPELPPTVGGVADYTVLLTRRLVAVTDGAVEPMLVRAGWKARSEPDVEYPVEDLGEACSAARLANTIERRARTADGPAVVLLQYSGYSYAKRGAPLWLARGLGRVCGDDGIPLVTMFHEISASGPIWTSAFWLAPVQGYVARRLAQQSAAVMTNHSTAANTLRGFVGDETPVRLCPVFSNVGEPAERPSYEARPARAVIFGGDRTKTALYDTHREITQSALDQWCIDTVVDVGPPGATQSDALDVPVDVRGLQPAEAISDLLLDARIGLLHYPAAYATKSGVLAAYMAHGAVPVLVAPEPLGGRLEAGTHFAVAGQDEDCDGSRIARAAAAWYDRHAHSRHAADAALTLMERALDMPLASMTPSASE